MLEAGETFGEIESVKAVADLNAPVAGEVRRGQHAIEEHLEILSKDPWNAGLDDPHPAPDRRASKA